MLRQHLPSPSLQHSWSSEALWAGKNTQNSITRTELWWEALAEIQPSAAFGLGSSQSRSGFVRAQSLMSSVAPAKPLLRDATAQKKKKLKNHRTCSHIPLCCPGAGRFQPSPFTRENRGGRGRGKGSLGRSRSIPAWECSWGRKIARTSGTRAKPNGCLTKTT